MISRRSARRLSGDESNRWLSTFCSLIRPLWLQIRGERDEGFSFSRHVSRLQIYGLGQAWRGGNMKSDAGGGQKINILRENLAPYKDEKDKLILFSDSYDVIFTQPPDFLLKKFETFRPARIVFGAEDFCWPDQNLQVRLFFSPRDRPSLTLVSLAVRLSVRRIE